MILLDILIVIVLIVILLGLLSVIAYIGLFIFGIILAPFQLISELFKSSNKDSNRINNASSHTRSVDLSNNEIQSMIDSIDYSKHPKDSIGYRYNKRKNK